MKRRDYMLVRRAGPVVGSRRPQNCRCGRWLPKGGTCSRCLDAWRLSLVVMALVLGLLVARGAL